MFEPFLNRFSVEVGEVFPGFDLVPVSRIPFFDGILFVLPHAKEIGTEHVSDDDASGCVAVVAVDRANRRRFRPSVEHHAVETKHAFTFHSRETIENPNARDAGPQGARSGELWVHRAH